MFFSSFVPNLVQIFKILICFLTNLEFWSSPNFWSQWCCHLQSCNRVICDNFEVLRLFCTTPGSCTSAYDFFEAQPLSGLYLCFQSDWKVFNISNLSNFKCRPNWLFVEKCVYFMQAHMLYSNSYITVKTDIRASIFLPLI